MRLARRTVLAACCALGAAGVRAAECEFPVFGESLPSLEHAATAALRALHHAGDPYESGGFVIEQGGVFRASKPVTQRSRSDVSYCIVLPRDAKLAGLYHTHVGHAGFSSRDRRNAERAGVPSFVGTIRGGARLVYDPKAGKISALAAPAATPALADSRDTHSLAVWLERAERWLYEAAAFLREAWGAIGS